MRPPKPWYRASNDAWYVKLDGRQIRLAKGKSNKATAVAAFHKLMATEKAMRVATISVGQVCNLYVAHANAKLAALTGDFYRKYLDSFAQHAGRMAVSEVLPLHVTAWLAKHPSWGQSSRSGAITAVKRAFRWARIEGHIPTNPLAEMAKPSIRPRETILLPEQANEIRASIAAGDPFGDLLDTLRDSGCRPSEAMSMQAKHLDVDNGVVKMASKTTAATGRERVIHLTPKLVQRLQELAVANPSGPLLLATAPTAGGQPGPWTRHTVAHRFARLRKRLGMGKEATAESYRHLFATDLLMAGVPIATVAELMGHRSTAMVEKHYSHLRKRYSHLKEALAKARGGQVPSPHFSGPQIESGPENPLSLGLDGVTTPERVDPAGTKHDSR